MKITKEQVKKVAGLARLCVNENDIEKLTRQMEDIIGFADRLGEINPADGCECGKTEEIINAFREDIPGISYPREDMLSNAPEKCDGCYLVPRVVE